MTDGLVWRVEADWTGVSLVGAMCHSSAVCHDAPVALEHVARLV